MSEPTQSFYTVGRKVFQLDVIGNHGEHRPIPVQVWYPSHQHEGQTAVYTSARYGVPHGSGDLPIDYYITLERIAAQGFIVAAPAHMNNTSDDARIDYLNAAANRTVLRCFDSLPSPSRTSVLDSIVDRARDIGGCWTRCRRGLANVPI